ncbi:hypothetical protein [Nostoc sp.]|uniref:hypothetical protein n=1 Tax=Nostoc sp. TaxID=1180 RepID=UPI002FFD097A
MYNGSIGVLAREIIVWDNTQHLSKLLVLYFMLSLRNLLLLPRFNTTINHIDGHFSNPFLVGVLEIA